MYCTHMCRCILCIYWLSVQFATEIKLQSYAALASQLGFSQFCLVIVFESQPSKMRAPEPHILLRFSLK